MYRNRRAKLHVNGVGFEISTFTLVRLSAEILLELFKLEFASQFLFKFFRIRLIFTFKAKFTSVSFDKKLFFINDIEQCFSLMTLNNVI